MITEDRVTFEIAKLLEEKGFDFFGEPTDTNSKLKKCGNDEIITAPTIHMVLKWLREVHNIDVTITPDRKENYTAMIFVNKELPFTSIGSFQTYEKACEAAIKYILENLI